MTDEQREHLTRSLKQIDFIVEDLLVTRDEMRKALQGNETIRDIGLEAAKIEVWHQEILDGQFDRSDLGTEETDN